MSSGIGNRDFNIFPVFHTHPHLQYGSIADRSLFVQCPIDISWVDWVINIVSGNSIFLNEASIAVDAFCSTIQYRLCIDFLSVVYDSNIQLHRRTAYISNCIWWYIENFR